MQSPFEAAISNIDQASQIEPKSPMNILTEEQLKENEMEGPKGIDIDKPKLAIADSQIKTRDFQLDLEGHPTEHEDKINEGPFFELKVSKLPDAEHQL